MGLFSDIATAVPVGQSAASFFPNAPGSNTGAYSTAGQIAGLGATGASLGASAVVATTASASTEAAAASLAAAVPIVGAIVAGVILVLVKFFKGADPRQVPASKITQIFLIAGRMVGYAYMHGMITREQGLAGLNSFLQAASTWYDQNAEKLGKTITANSKANIKQTVTNQINAMSGATPVASESLDTSQIGSWPVQTNPYTGAPILDTYYSDSVASGRQVAKVYLDSVGSSVADGLLSNVANGFSQGADVIAQKLGIDSKTLKVLGGFAVALFVIKRFI